MDERRKVARCGATDVWVWQGDITAAGTEAVVNAANNEGWLGSGVAGAIRRAAGDQVEAEAVAQAPWPVGDAVRTGPGRLGERGVRAILHAAAMAPGRPASADAVGRATAAALRLAAAEGLASVALPALGTGVGGVAMEAAAEAMGAAVRDHAAGPTPVTTSCSPSTTRRRWSGSGGPWSGSWDATMDAEVDGVEARVGGDHLAAGGLLERIVAWAGQVVGTPNGYICLIEPDSGEMVLRLGTGAYTGLVGLRMLKGEGLSGRVWETGAPLAIPDYSTWEGRVRQIAAGAFRAVLGVPLVSGGDGHPA